jgi:hypothetical protein
MATSNRTYWRIHQRGFRNEYTIGIATTPADAEQYKAEDYFRIDRTEALSAMSRRAGNGEQLYIGVTIDGEQVYDRFETARELRRGDAA